MRKIYFAHPVNTYNQPIEASFLRLIAENITGRLNLIENPNQPHHQAGYNKWAKRQKKSDTKHVGMSYYYDIVLPECSGCAAVAFLDGRLGLGVAGEAKWFIERQKPVWLIMPTHDPEASGVEEFIKNPSGGFFRVGFASEDEQQLILSNDSKIVVPHEETRLRTWRTYGCEMRPYEEAHLVKMPIPEDFYPDSK